jgi:hypothetical protein
MPLLGEPMRRVGAAEQAWQKIRVMIKAGLYCPKLNKTKATVYHDNLQWKQKTFVPPQHSTSVAAEGRMSSCSLYTQK